MHIQVSIDGGLVAAPGLAKPIVLDDASLAPSERLECNDLVRAALDTGPATAQPSHAPDARNYRIQIHDDKTTHSLAATDIAMSPAFSKLISFVRKHGSR